MLILLALCWLLIACGERQPELVHLTGATMGTTYSVKALGVPDSIAPETLQTGVNSLLEGVNRKMSTYDSESELSRFNRNAGTDWVEISDELLTVMEEALRVSRLSDGAFDVTVGPLVNLWGFGPEMGEDDIPSEEAIDAALIRVGYERIQLQSEPPAMRKERSDVYVDLSAAAKGYAVDKVADYLESRGISDYLVEIGGELRAKGHNPGDNPWTIAIEKPAPGEQSIQRVVRLTEGGVATSGDYRNFFEKDGQRYSHVIDPHTGWPVRHQLASVTVISDTCMHADALATTLLVLGPDTGFELAEREQLAAFFVVIENNGFVEKSTPAFAQYLVN